MTRVVFLDLIGGCSGDMLLAALLDLGAPEDAIRDAWELAGLVGVELVTHEVRSFGLRARGVDVTVSGELADSRAEHHRFGGHAHGHGSEHAHGDHDAHAHGGRDAHAHRSFLEIRERLGSSRLSPIVREQALRAFEGLGRAEADAHGVRLEHVQLHEVGADDAIADVVGVFAALDALEIDEVVASTVPLARGLGRSAHGPLPFPGPATLALLAGAPVEDVPFRGETVTPTGAALLSVLARFGPMPSMRLERVGTGAGHASWPDRPNVVRAFLGEASVEASYSNEEASLVESTIDDLSPEHLPVLVDALLGAGALDAWWTPAHMKKGRVGAVVSALARRSEVEAVASAFFAHGTTLGVRVTNVARRVLPRTLIEVATELGIVRVKTSPRSVGPPLVKPEHEDCVRIAAERGVPVRVVYEAALRAAWRER
ncbi:MAG: nickel pincer cofactor biosynthesis protein LarC [Deltaproteobacteria bacterium]|nr:nickel pincer cofactor biosynthesis protein LarC [Deltaproteobacteria bacterium]